MNLGLIETARVEDGCVPLWPRHLRRLVASAEVLGLPLPDRLPSAEDIVGSARGIAGIAAVRVTMTDAEVRLEPRPVPAVVDGWRATLVPHPSKNDALLAHKTTLRAQHEMAAALAHAKGYQEALWMDGSGDLREGTITNVFVCLRGRIVTPTALGDNLLPGIARGCLLDAGMVAGWPIIEGGVRLADLRQADEVFVTNAVRGAVPLWSVEGTELRRGSRWREALGLIFSATGR